MNLSDKLKKIQIAMQARNMANRVLLFDGWDDYEKAMKAGKIRHNDHCLIDDIPADDDKPIQ